LGEFVLAFERQNQDEEDQVLEAARNGDITVVREALQRGATGTYINRKCGDGRTAMIEAARHGQSEVAQMLLDFNANPNVQDDSGRTALLEAAGRGHANMVIALLRHGADPNLQDCDGRTALICAAAREGAAVVSLLLDHGANPNAQEHDGLTALIQATCERQVENIRTLLQRGANPNLIQGDRTALMVAAQFGDARLVHLLLEHGADPLLCNANNEMALDLAMKRGNQATVTVLREAMKFSGPGAGGRSGYGR
jgi:uncharacterized protein